MLEAFGLATKPRPVRVYDYIKFSPPPVEIKTNCIVSTPLLANAIARTLGYPDFTRHTVFRVDEDNKPQLAEHITRNLSPDNSQNEIAMDLYITAENGKVRSNEFSIYAGQFNRVERNIIEGERLSKEIQQLLNERPLQEKIISESIAFAKSWKTHAGLAAALSLSYFVLGIRQFFKQGKF